MKDPRTLFEKLRTPDPGPEARRQRQLIDSILVNLRRVLNTRRGNSPSAPEYGVIDLSSILHNYPESIQEMADSIQKCIERYEPRLTAVRVLHDQSDTDVLTLRFRISAKIQVVGGSGSVDFDTLITSSGRVNVSV